MKHIGFVLLALISVVIFTGCMKNEIPDFSEAQQQQINENAKRIFGITFDKNQDWCTTINGNVTITDISSDVEKIQILVYTNEDTNEEGMPITSMKVLNEVELNGEESVTINYDAPKNNIGLFISLISGGNYQIKKIDSNTVSMTRRSAFTRSLSQSYTLPDESSLVIGKIEDSYAQQRGWMESDKLYSMSSYSSQKMSVEDYSDSFKEEFRAMVFSYLPDGRKYNNLSKIKSSGLYNGKVYPITTGDEPIIISAAYKCDQAKRYGNEVYYSDLYYYYFDESKLGDNPVEYIKSLPKYKAFQFKECFGETEDDKIAKHGAFALVYWGDGTPEIGTKGTYTFPKGYKIGFMVRANTTSEAPRKQGELYADGRLNDKINAWPNFSSSKLDSEGPRAGWLTLNGRLLMVWESGTDTDFNDIVLDIEGGIEDIIVIPEEEYQTYTYCFEDTKVGDYDMNDVVIKAIRRNANKVEYSVIACGAYDKLYIKNINSGNITDSKEVHEMFGYSEGMFINTLPISEKAKFVTADKKVDKTFSLLDPNTQPYIYDATTGIEIHLSKKGENPFGIMIPNDFKYPYEKVCIKDAYEQFNSWGANYITSTDWYKHSSYGFVYE